MREKRQRREPVWNTLWEKGGEFWVETEFMSNLPWIFPLAELVSQSELVADWLLCGSTSTAVGDQRPRSVAPTSRKNTAMVHISKMEHVLLKWSILVKWSMWLSNGAHQSNGAAQ
jgi:hypothetical protein